MAKGVKPDSACAVKQVVAVEEMKERAIPAFLLRLQERDQALGNDVTTFYDREVAVLLAHRRYRPLERLVEVIYDSVIHSSFLSARFARYRASFRFGRI